MYISLAQKVVTGAVVALGMFISAAIPSANHLAAYFR